MTISQQTRSIEEQRLDVFAGRWSNSGRVLHGPFGPGGEVIGETGYRWDIGGKWLVHVSRLELPGLGAYEVHGGVAFDSRTGKYDAYAVNSLGNLLVYEGDWTDDATLVFTLVYPKPGSARVIYRILADGSFEMASEKASGEGGYEPYFELGFVRS